MPKAHDREHDKELEQHRRDTLGAVIAEQLLHILGEPRDLLKVQVRAVWANSYRVNVLVGDNPASAKVAHSYFLTADGNGNIIESTPKITTRYATPERD